MTVTRGASKIITNEKFSSIVFLSKFPLLQSPRYQSSLMMFFRQVSNLLAFASNKQGQNTVNYSTLFHIKRDFVSVSMLKNRSLRSPNMASTTEIWLGKSIALSFKKKMFDYCFRLSYLPLIHRQGSIFKIRRPEMNARQVNWDCCSCCFIPFIKSVLTSQDLRILSILHHMRSAVDMSLPAFLFSVHASHTFVSHLLPGVFL